MLSLHQGSGQIWKVNFHVSQLKPGGFQGLLWCDMTPCVLRGKASYCIPYIASASDYAFWYCPETICSSFEEFSGFTDVLVLLKPAVMLWMRTYLPPGMWHVFSTILPKHYFASSSSSTKGGIVFYTQISDSRPVKSTWAG